MFEKDTPKILIVEDNVSNHELFIEAFTAGGFAVTIYPFIDSTFLADVISLQPDIISMDIMIAGPVGNDSHDGFSAIALLKSHEQTKDIPIMMLSNFFEESKIAKAKTAGVVDFISLQGHSITAIPNIFKRYLDNPKEYLPIHPVFREG
jgi:CheY-like chemotaxis protein